MIDRFGPVIGAGQPHLKIPSMAAFIAKFQSEMTHQGHGSKFRD
jgi:hypothetical protein